ncbi:hypothetical protein ACEW7V_02605 [Areca yellow leaf disease phytoplasma]|uniref:hypothetical protein n=1 Tax=Areca yellow leaf disease phytoplasma TaxID=927614 RepID=UPI0035B56170
MALFKKLLPPKHCSYSFNQFQNINKFFNACQKQSQMLSKKIFYSIIIIKNIYQCLNTLLPRTNNKKEQKLIQTAKQIPLTQLNTLTKFFTTKMN